MMAFIKCVIANRFCLLGYLLLFCSIYFFNLETSSGTKIGFIITGFASLCLLLRTWFGIETHFQYQRVLETHSRKSVISKADAATILEPYRQYCGRVGAQLAIADHNTRYRKRMRKHTKEGRV